MKNDDSIIEKAFKKEIGIDIYNAINILYKEGITPEVLKDVTNKLKDIMTDEIEIRNISYEYRFLMINVILCTMLDTTIQYQKKFAEAINEIEKDNEIGDISINTFINKR